MVGLGPNVEEALSTSISISVGSGIDPRIDFLIGLLVGDIETAVTILLNDASGGGKG